MGRSAGPGSPITFMCQGQKKSTYWDNRGPLHKVIRTGRTAKRTYRSHSALGQRSLLYRVEYRCLDCGHVGWTNHKGILAYPLED